MEKEPWKEVHLQEGCERMILATLSTDFWVTQTNKVGNIVYVQREEGANEICAV